MNLIRLNAMKPSIKQVLDANAKGLVFDKKLAKTIEAYGRAFTNKNEDHIHFFGSNLTGVYPVRFTTADRHEWNIDILNIDEAIVRKQIIDLPTVNESWVRGTDVMNLYCLWMVHRFSNSSLPDKEKHKAMMDTLMVLHYKLISSLMAHFFPYPVNKGLAQATYDQLTLKFSIKREGNWYSLLKDRCEDILSKDSIHLDTIKKMDDDNGVQYFITDVQGRLRSILVNICEVLYDLKERDAKSLTTQSMIEIDGQMVVRDMSRQFNHYKDYIQTVVLDELSFIKPELVQIICSAMPTMPEQLLIDALKMTVALSVKQERSVVMLVETTMLHIFDQMVKDRSVQKKITDLPALIAYMRSLYTASRSKGDVEKMRILGERIIKKYVKAKNESAVAATRTGLMLYIVLRTFTKNHYG